jgi:hypothetical protein
MAKSAFYEFRKALGLLKTKNDPFTADELLLMDVAAVLRWGGCGLKVLSSFCQFWGSPQAPLSLKDRVEVFLSNYQVPINKVWQSLPANVREIEPVKFFAQLIGEDNVSTN